MQHPTPIVKLHRLALRLQGVADKHNQLLVHLGRVVRAKYVILVAGLAGRGLVGLVVLIGCPRPLDAIF